MPLFPGKRDDRIRLGEGERDAGSPHGRATCQCRVCPIGVPVANSVPDLFRIKPACGLILGPKKPDRFALLQTAHAVSQEFEALQTRNLGQRVILMRQDAHHSLLNHGVQAMFSFGLHFFGIVFDKLEANKLIDSSDVPVFIGNRVDRGIDGASQLDV